MSTRSPGPEFKLPRELFQFCPKCGARGMVREKNCLNCTSCGFIYYLNPVSSVIAIIRNERNQILLTRRKFEPHIGKLDLPGGFVDFNETLEEALQREIKEELNIEVANLNYFASFPTEYPFKQVIYQPIDAVFECSVKNWEGMAPCDDVAEICFRLPREVRFEEIAFSSNCRILELLFKIGE